MNKRMKTMIDIKPDSHRSLIEQVPLKERLLTLRQVCTEWTKTVEDLCATQKELILQIGSGNRREEIYKKTEHYFRIQAVNPLHSLTTSQLSEELTTFLSTTFPRLQTLVVVVDDPTEDVNFLLHLPRLISAYLNTLTTLQLVWNVKNVIFQEIFSQLISSISSLHKLQIFSFLDSASCLEVPPFDLPLLLRTSLDKLIFVSENSSSGLALHWVPSLLTRTKPNLMQICYRTNIDKSPFPSSFPVEAAAHFYDVMTFINNAAELEHFTSAFTNLTTLSVVLSPLLSMGSLFTQLSKLPQLNCLQMAIFKQIEAGYNSTNLPVLPAVQQLFLQFDLEKPFQHAQLDQLRLSKVFPSVEEFHLWFYNHHCLNCNWQIMVSEDGSSPKLEGTDDQVTQCITLMATLFAKTKPTVRVIFKVKSQIVLHYAANFADEKLMMLTKYEV